LFHQVRYQVKFGYLAAAARNQSVWLSLEIFDLFVGWLAGCWMDILFSEPSWIHTVLADEEFAYLDHHIGLALGPPFGLVGSVVECFDDQR
jgi:hypothetical protein